jgi:hypothetical protein
MYTFKWKWSIEQPWVSSLDEHLSTWPNLGGSAYFGLGPSFLVVYWLIHGPFLFQFTLIIIFIDLCILISQTLACEFVLLPSQSSHNLFL